LEKRDVFSVFLQKKITSSSWSKNYN